MSILLKLLKSIFFKGLIKDPRNVSHYIQSRDNIKKSLTPIGNYITFKKGIKFMLEKVFKPGMTPFEKSLESKGAPETLSIYANQHENMILWLNSIMDDIIDIDYLGSVNIDEDFIEDTKNYALSRNKFEMFKSMGAYDHIYQEIEDNRKAEENFEKAFTEQGGEIRWQFTDNGTIKHYVKKEDKQ